MLADEVEHLSITTPRDMPIKIGAKVARRGRHVAFQLAEIAIPRRLFVEDPPLIDGPRPKPAPTGRPMASRQLD